MGRKAPGQGVARDVEEDTVKLFEARLRGPLGVRPALPAIPQGAQRVPGSHEGMARDAGSAPQVPGRRVYQFCTRIGYLTRFTRSLCF